MSYTRKWTNEEHEIAMTVYKTLRDCDLHDEVIVVEIQKELEKHGYPRTLDAVRMWKYKHVTLKKGRLKVLHCYREGGCGPYEGRSCTECPASKPEYMREIKLRNSLRLHRHMFADSIVFDEILKFLKLSNDRDVVCIPLDAKDIWEINKGGGA